MSVVFLSAIEEVDLADEICHMSCVTQILDKLHNVINVAVPYFLIAVASVITSGLLVRSAVTARRPSQQTAGENEAAGAVPSTSAEPERKPKPEAGGANGVDKNEDSFRRSCIAQVLSSVAFLLLCIPAHVHQTVVEAAMNDAGQHVVDGVNDVAFVSHNSYTTQRLLLVAWYARHGTIFTVHFTVDVFFRRRCGALFARLIRSLVARLTRNACGRCKIVCCSRNRPANYGGKTMVIDRTQMQMAASEPVAV
jgi:hypothetical protein